MFTLPPKAIWLMYIPSLYLFSYLLNVHSCDYAIRRKFLGLLTVFWLERLGFVKFYIVTHTHTQRHTRYPCICLLTLMLCGFYGSPPVFLFVFLQVLFVYLASGLTLPCHHTTRRQKKKAKFSDVPSKQGKMDASPKK